VTAGACATGTRDELIGRGTRRRPRMALRLLLAASAVAAQSGGTDCDASARR
jgi:hypothetical protein